MLHKKTVEAKTLGLLKRLQEDPISATMRLVGGTSLALQIAHRKSTDLDLFTYERIDTREVSDHLIQYYGFEPKVVTGGALIGFIDGIKVDFINHPYKWLDDIVVDGPFRLASIRDISAMKMHAIAHSGTRPKDFVDVTFLSKYFTYNEIKANALLKYPSYDPIMFDKSIIYFNDVDTESIEDIKMIGYKMDWSAIKGRINSMTDFPDKLFRNAPLKRI